MNFLMTKFALILCLAAIVVIGLLFYNRKKYFDWVETHWFFKKTFLSTCSFVMMALSFLLLLLSLLDVRGPQEQMEIDIPEQKTVIMIDTSASMLVEDVKPNRFKRALFMAKHFVKKSIGHQVGVVLFSDIQKSIVPFTDDVDLLDARISGLDLLNISRGGSNIAQAIQESLQYFQSSDKNSQNIFGNILIFSDSEETNSSFEVNIPDKFNVAFVGVGTLNGGKIPLRNKRGSFRGYKRYDGQDVISKLNENYIKKLGSQMANYKYWIASSYTIYTDEIINFFEKSFFDELESSRMSVIRPVWSHYIASAGIVFYILSVVFSQFRSFQKCIAILFMAVWGGGDGQARADNLMNLEKLKRGELDKVQRLKLAEKFLRKDENEKALKLYRESMGQWKDWDFPTLLNYGVALFKNGKIEEGIRVYDYLYRKGALGEAEKEAVQSNLMKILEEQENNRSEKGQDEEGDGEKGEEEKGAGGKDDKKSSEGQDGEEKNSEEGDEGGRGDKKQGGDSGESGNEEKNDQSDDSGKREERENGNRGEQFPSEKKTLTGRAAFEERKKNMERQKKLTKIPETLKSIMHKDRTLQDKFFDTSTHTQKRNRQKKDW